MLNDNNVYYFGRFRIVANEIKIIINVFLHFIIVLLLWKSHKK